MLCLEAHLDYVDTPVACTHLIVTYNETHCISPTFYVCMCSINAHEQGLLELAITAQRAVVAAEPDGRVTSTIATSSATSATSGSSTTSTSAGARRSSGDSSRAGGSSSSSAQQPSGYAARYVFIAAYTSAYSACMSACTRRSSKQL
jgi:hypothetical protein